MQNAIDSHATFRNNIPSPGISFFHRLYGIGLADEEYQAIMNLLDAFNPQTVLWVRDEGWSTAASSRNDIKRIVFSEGIINIPGFPLSLFDYDQGLIELETVHLPKTVRNIETQAFTHQQFSISKLIIQSVDGLYTQKNGLSGVEEVIRALPLFRDDLLNLTPYLDWNYTNQGMEFNFVDNPEIVMDNMITSYKPLIIEDFLYIQFFSNDSLVGYATNAHVTDYFLNKSDSHPYYTHVSKISRFYEPHIPPGCDDFSGWYLENGSIMQKDDSLDCTHTIVVAG
jgi:hypothetical protein